MSDLKVHIFVIGGYGVGESIVVVFRTEGNVVFSMTIDSCTSNIEGNNVVLPLKLLQRFHIAKLDCIVWTHPHDDHSQGMDEIVRKYYGKKTIGVIPKQLYGNDRNIVKISGCCQKVLNTFFRTFKKRNLKSMECLENEVRLLFERTFIDYETGEEKVLSLKCMSPMAEKLDDKVRNGLLLSNSQLNELSLTLTLAFDNYRFYFGGDAPDNVLKNTNSSELEQSRWIKIPHHGSLSSKCLIGLLNRHIDSAAATAYLSQGLPHEDVLIEYSRKTDNLYITQQTNDTVYNFGMIEYEYQFEGAEINLDIRRYGNAYKYETVNEDFEQHIYE